MFELQILLANIVVPAATILIVCLLTLRNNFTHLVIAASSGLAIWAAFAIRVGFAWWPEDAWQKVPVAAILISTMAIIVDSFRQKLVRSKDNASSAEDVSKANPKLRSTSLDLVFVVAIAAAAARAAMLIYPSGDAWASIQDQRVQWCVVMTLAASLGWWGLAGCQPSVASTVGFATIPLLIASAFLNSLSMMKVTEPLIAIATVLGLCSLIDLRLSGRRSLPVMIAPTLFAMSGFIAHANFQSYLGLPRTLYFLAMLSPAIVALVARMAQQKTTRFAIGLTVVLALLLAVSIGAWAYIEGEVRHADEW